MKKKGEIPLLFFYFLSNSGSISKEFEERRNSKAVRSEILIKNLLISSHTRLYFVEHLAPTLLNINLVCNIFFAIRGGRDFPFEMRAGARSIRHTEFCEIDSNLRHDFGAKYRWLYWVPTYHNYEVDCMHSIQFHFLRTSLIFIEVCVSQGLWLC